MSGYDPTSIPFYARMEREREARKRGNGSELAEPIGSAGVPRYRDGTPKWTVCHCGMQMLQGATCSVCNYTANPPNAGDERPAPKPRTI